mgnify:CR=1 FL=1
MPSSRRRRSPSGMPKSQSPRPASSPSSVPDGDGGSEEDSSGKDHYDYQEMIDHLRKVRGSTEQQGLKSKKKRRRRSHQPIVQRRKRRNVSMITFLLIVLPIVAFVGGSFLFSYLAYEGERFRKEMSGQVGAMTGFEGEFAETFSTSKFSFKNRKYSGIGPDDSILAEMDLVNLEIYPRFGSLMTDEWDISRFIVDEGKFHLRPMVPPVAGAAVDETASVTKIMGPDVLAAKLGFSGAPASVKFDRISFRNFSASFGHNIEIIHNILNLHVVMNRTQTGYFINCDRGSIEYFYWPKFTVTSSDLSLSDDGILKIHLAALEAENGGTCEMTGTVVLTGPNPSIDLSMEVENIKVDELVNGATWSDRVLGLLSGELKLVGGLTTTDPPVLTGKISIPGLSVKNLEFLDSLEKFCGISQLKRVEFELFEAQIEQRGSTIRIHDIFGSNPVGLTGEFTVQANHDLDGEMEIGLADSTLRNVGGGRPSFFVSRGDDSPYGWAKFSVTGKLDSPVDDLRRKFETILQGDWDPREHRPMTSFRRPLPLAQGAEEVYLHRLQQLFDRLSE